MTLYIWRHPKPIAADGICLGQTDIAVDPRKLKRLANQIQGFARKHKLAKVIWVSTLQRSLKVGEILAQRGFEVRQSDKLSELDFGTWDGQAWPQIGKAKIDDWCNNFAEYNFETGESLTQLFARVEEWLQLQANQEKVVLAIGHAGWINAVKMLADHQPIPKLASDWAAPVDYNELSILEFH